jgi:ABC-type proline/glycine betaine transport system substrate-binding protein
MMRWLCVAAVSFALTAAASAQLPLEPAKESGQSVSPAYEGWFKNSDGTFTLLVGYFNRNLKQVVDIPAGPDNRRS